MTQNIMPPRYHFRSDMPSLWDIMRKGVSDAYSTIPEAILSEPAVQLPGGQTGAPYFAACALDEGSADASFHIAAAKRLADCAAIANAQDNIQVHGGIGTTNEASPHLVLKRAHMLTFVAPVATAELLVPTAGGYPSEAASL